MSTDESPRDARLAATALLPAIDPTTAPSDDFGATTLDRPAFDLEDLAAMAHAPPEDAPAPLPPPRARPSAPPESDALLWVLLALSLACALGVATGLAVAVAAALGGDEPAAVETDDARRRGL